MNEFPRLRMEKRRPASPWWMVRGDRLSHPAAFAFDGGRLYGLCASPCFVVRDGKKQAWAPGDAGDFFQYAGFTCSLEQGSVGYTLGYENAPWLFVESHTVWERVPLGGNCFRLDPGEEVSFEMCLIDCQAKNERMVYGAVRSVYARYHEAPRVASDMATAVNDIALAVYRDAWDAEDQSYCGFVFDEPGGFRRVKLSSISWTNGLSVAVPMLQAAIRLNHDPMRTQALTCIENIV